MYLAINILYDFKMGSTISTLNALLAEFRIMMFQLGEYESNI